MKKEQVVKDPTKNGQLSPLDIKYRLQKLGFTQVQIAKKLAVSGGVISNTIHGRITCHSVAQHIASLLKTDVATLWPDRYCFKPRTKVRSSDLRAAA